MTHADDNTDTCLCTWGQTFEGELLGTTRQITTVHRRCPQHGPKPRHEHTADNTDRQEPTMTERHEHTATVEQDDNGGWYDIRDEWHTFVRSGACDSSTAWGYVSMRCSLAYRGCDDRACVCHCHDKPRTVESSVGGTGTSSEEQA